MTGGPNGQGSGPRSPRPGHSDATEAASSTHPATSPVGLGWILVGIAALLFGVVCGLIMSSVGS